MEGISLHVPLNKLEYRSTVKHRTEHPTQANLTFCT